MKQLGLQLSINNDNIDSDNMHPVNPGLWVNDCNQCDSAMIASFRGFDKLNLLQLNPALRNFELEVVVEDYIAPDQLSPILLVLSLVALVPPIKLLWDDFKRWKNPEGKKTSQSNCCWQTVNGLTAWVDTKKASIETSVNKLQKHYLATCLENKETLKKRLVDAVKVLEDLNFLTKELLN